MLNIVVLTILYKFIEFLRFSLTKKQFSDMMRKDGAPWVERDMAVLEYKGYTITVDKEIANPIRGTAKFVRPIYKVVVANKQTPVMHFVGYDKAELLAQAKLWASAGAVTTGKSTKPVDVDSITAKVDELKESSSNMQELWSWLSE